MQKRTLECRSKDNTYKQCKIDGGYLVNSVKLKIQFDKKLSCNEGINYGIVSDSIFVKDGCNGIFDGITLTNKPCNDRIAKLS